jgi:hypothetical protein
MAGPAEYYAITRGAAATSQASGLVRRRLTPSGRADESLRRDGSWQPSSALFEWEMGDVSPRRISAITEAEAEMLTAKLRDQWTATTAGTAATSTAAELGGISSFRQA